MEFSEIISNQSQLRELIGAPSPRAAAKTMATLNQHCRDFIGRCPFLLIASSDAQGAMDISPKGDPPGFVRVLDDETLLVPDRPGNRRADTYMNVLENPSVAVFFLIPGKTESLRVGGTAQIVRDAELRHSMAVKGKIPEFALAISVREVFFHCSKCVIRSKLWKPGDWPELDGLPTLAETLIASAGLTAPVEEIEASVKQAERDNLY